MQLHRSKLRAKCSPATRMVCTACGHWKCRSAFTEGKRQCRSCRARIERERAAAAVAEARRGLVTQITGQLVNPRSLRRDLAGMIEAAFGGPEEFCDLLVNQLKTACKEKPATKTTLNGLFRIIDFWFDVWKEQQKRAVDVASLTPDELNAELLECAIIEMSQDPALLHQVADALGYEITAKEGEPDAHIA